MFYTRFIRYIVEESINASLGGYSIKDVLTSADCDNDLIRKTLVLTVCDPRFEITVRPTESWQTPAQKKLEDFALSLMDINELDEDTAMRIMEEFLAEYFYNIIQLQPGCSRHLPLRTDNKRDGEDNMNFSLSATFGEENNEEENTIPDDEVSSHDRLSPEEERRVQTRFMRNIPESLVKLAKLIGRAGDSDSISSGHFLTAAKSDIAGITIGNDLSNLLPSEIAMLSCQQTQNIFFYNYVERRLQVFASVSSGNKVTQHHQDGPVIICLDTSGSMQGRPAEIARILTMAVTIVAQRQRRKVIVVKYADRHHLFIVKNLRRQRKDLIDYLSIYSGGGNNEEDMFQWLFCDILPGEADDFDSADVLCISDFGWDFLSDNVFDMIKANKEKGMKFYGLDITGNGLGKKSFRNHSNSGVYADFREPEAIGSFHAPDEVIDSSWLWKEELNCCIEEQPIL